MEIGLMESELSQIYPMWQQQYIQRCLGRSVKVTLQDGTVLMGVFRTVEPPVSVQLSSCLQHAAGSSMYLGNVTVEMQNILLIDVI